MRFLELAARRRSVRKYSSRPVPREVIERCLEAARLSPSACNSQPWTFIIVDGEKTRGELARAAFSGVYSMNAFAGKAPVLVAVVTEKSGYAARLGGYLRGTQYSLLDVGIAVEHFVLQAAEDGVGTCWLGWFNEKAVKELLGIPAAKKVDVLVSMGYPETEKEVEKQRKPPAQMSRFHALSPDGK